MEPPRIRRIGRCKVRHDYQFVLRCGPALSAARSRTTRGCNFVVLLLVPAIHAVQLQPGHRGPVADQGKKVHRKKANADGLICN